MLSKEEEGGGGGCPVEKKGNGWVICVGALYGLKKKWTFFSGPVKMLGRKHGFFLKAKQVKGGKRQEKISTIINTDNWII